MRALLLLLLPLGACATPDVATVTPDDGGTGPRVLCVFAHPDDETTVAGALYKTATLLDGTVDMVLITNGEGGFKYSTLAERMYGLELTREDVGRAHLPHIRREEMLAGCALLGVHQVHFLEETDHRYSQDPLEVLGEDADVWDLARIAAKLDEVLAAADYDFVLTMAPSPTTHGHHQAATVLAARAVARLDEAARPVLLGSAVETEEGGVPLAPLALVFDRTQSFGHRQRLDYRVIVNFVIAQHLSQGTMQLAMSRGLREHYFVFTGAPPGAHDRARAWMDALAAPQFPVREYGTSAGTNAR
jgi:LmbE family N-acetylglucosaminyl deacetylase